MCCVCDTKAVVSFSVVSINSKSFLQTGSMLPSKVTYFLPTRTVFLPKEKCFYRQQQFSDSHCWIFCLERRLLLMLMILIRFFFFFVFLYFISSDLRVCGHNSDIVNDSDDLSINSSDVCTHINFCFHVSMFPHTGRKICSREMTFLLKKSYIYTNSKTHQHLVWWWWWGGW